MDYKEFAEMVDNIKYAYEEGFRDGFEYGSQILRPGYPVVVSKESEEPAEG